MDLSQYQNRAVQLNSTEAIDTLLKTLEDNLVKSSKPYFDFGQFDISVRLLIRKMKIQLYFIEKLASLRLRTPQSPPTNYGQDNSYKSTEQQKTNQKSNTRVNHPKLIQHKNRPIELGKRIPSGFIKVIGETPRSLLKESPKSIVIYSRKASEAISTAICRSCFKKAIWHYSESNIGAIDLCNACKGKLFQESYRGKSDTIHTVVNRNKKR